MFRKVERVASIHCRWQPPPLRRPTQHAWVSFARISAQCRWEQKGLNYRTHHVVSGDLAVPRSGAIFRVGTPYTHLHRIDSLLSERL